MRILYLTQYFEPEPAIKGIKFVKGLSDRGHYVEVVTGFPNYPGGRIYQGHRLSFYKREVIDGIVVHRIPLFPSHDMSSVGRAANYISFFLSAAIFSAFIARQFDVIYSYPPMTVGLAAWFAGWIARRPFLLDIQDLWPDSVVKSGMTGTSKLEAPLNSLCNFLYRRASGIVSQSQGIKTRLVERGVPGEKISVIYNWADERAAAPADLCDLSPYRFADKFNFVYGGNLGRVQGLDVVVRAAHLARQRVPCIQLLLIGEGVERDNLKALVHSLGAENIHIAPGVPRQMIGDIFAAADVLTLHLWDDPLFAITIPQKTQFYLAMGKPILIGVRGEAADFVTSAGAGISAVPQNVMALADAMVQLANTPSEQLAEMGRKGREFYWRSFSFAGAITATEKALSISIERFHIRGAKELA